MTQTYQGLTVADLMICHRTFQNDSMKAAVILQARQMESGPAQVLPTTASSLFSAGSDSLVVGAVWGMIRGRMGLGEGQVGTTHEQEGEIISGSNAHQCTPGPYLPFLAQTRLLGLLEHFPAK